MALLVEAGKPKKKKGIGSDSSDSKENKCLREYNTISRSIANGIEGGQEEEKNEKI
jgi:hypothetical protein